MSFKLGILDQSPIFPEKTGFDALQATIRLAQKAEQWGYARFWVAEHHHMGDVAGASPEVLISHILARTNAIQVGSGGVMLQHYSPFKVAENFHVLSTLSPGRVDLGVGKSPGGLPLSTKALRYGTDNDGIHFEERLTFLKKLLDHSVEEVHPLSGIEALPKPPVKPGIFLLGGSASSARLAAELGVHFVFAKFLVGSEESLAQASRIYRKLYPDGTFMAAVAVFAVPCEKKAKQIADEHSLYKITIESGRTLIVQSYQQVEAFKKQAVEAFEVEKHKADMIAGTPEQVKGELERIHHQYEVDEFILHTPIRKEEERFRSFELLRPIAAARAKRGLKQSIKILP